MLEVDCVIVGGGIGGAVLALALGRRGHQVLILERESGTAPTARPEVLAQATMDEFERLGALGPILREAAVPLQGLEVWHGPRKVFRLMRDAFDAVGARPYSTDPARTRQILLERAAATAGVRVERGVEVLDLRREGGRVTGVTARRGDEALDVAARLVVGDDGTHSRVRAAMGVSIRLEELPVEFFAAAGPMVPGLPIAIGHVWIRPTAVARGLLAGLFLPLPAQRTAMVFIATHAAAEQLSAHPAAFARASTQLSPRCVGLSRDYPFPQAFARLRRPFGHAPTYVADGVALLGDAAHPVTPVGGQGANMSVADAAVLASVAHEALRRGDVSAAVLRPYQQQRWPANQRSLGFSAQGRRGLEFLQTVPGAGLLVPWLLRRLDAREDVKQRVASALAGAFRSDAASGPSSR
jgi:2-polyprenyl-6-methoxyphenol hydroxylase-like FAD-dependent oxidoreductase